jgi:hypothetical protein
MPDLDPRERALLESHRRNHGRLLVAAALLIVSGAGYASWAVLRFDPRAAIEQHAGFDPPVNALTRMYDPYQPMLRNLRPTTDTEQLLLWGLRANMSFTAGMLMTLLRVFLGLLLLLCGLFLITTAFERRRLVRILQRLLV